MDKEQLRKLQLTELSILIDFDKYCRENGIRYSISSGTLLGAVRHGGFIPWDDDIDIAMTRQNFNKLMAIWNSNPMSGYYMENYFRDKNCSISHTKIRKDGTVLRMTGDETLGKHSGIWIDIFVRDKVKNSWIASKNVKIQSIKKVLSTRGNETFGFDSGKKLVIKKILKLIPNGLRRKIFIDAENKLQRYSELEDNYYWVSTSTIRSCNCHFPKESLEKYREITFEGLTFMAFDDVDTLLKIEYGDYMQLPPEEKRVCSHNPAEIKLY